MSALASGPAACGIGGGRAMHRRPLACGRMSRQINIVVPYCARKPIAPFDEMLSDECLINHGFQTLR